LLVFNTHRSAIVWVEVRDTIPITLTYMCRRFAHLYIYSAAVSVLLFYCSWVRLCI